MIHIITENHPKLGTLYVLMQDSTILAKYATHDKAVRKQLELLGEAAVNKAMSEKNDSEIPVEI